MGFGPIPLGVCFMMQSIINGLEEDKKPDVRRGTTSKKGGSNKAGGEGVSGSTQVPIKESRHGRGIMLS